MSRPQIITPTVNYNSIPQVNKTASSKPSITRKASGGGNKKGTSAERRATHNAVERARRESLNVRFLELAANLPTTCTVRRPSKNLIVNKSLEFVRNALHNDAVLRLKLEESLRQNQSMLQELNQMRAERGLSPRDTQATNIDANQQAGFSLDALTSAFGMPNMPQPLASVEFTKQVTEKGIHFDANNAQWFSGEGDEDFVSNTASGDGFSAAASDHSSPSFVGEDANVAAVAAAAAAFPNNPMFANFNEIMAASQSSPYSSLQPTTTNVRRPGSSDSLDSNSMPNTYAQYAVGSGAAATNNFPSIDFMPPINPTTAAVFSNLMNNFNNQTNGSHTPQSVQYSAYASPMSNGGMSANGQGSSHNYSHHNNSYFAMTA